MTALRTKIRRWAPPVIITAAAVFAVRWNGFTLPVWLFEMRSGIVHSHADTNAKVVALTFDDGPDPAYTPRVLQILRGYGIKATFFDQGRMLRLYPALARQTIREGHVIGNHTDTHPYLERLTPEQVRSELDRCDTALAAVGVRTCLFRPPRGEWNPTVFRAVRARNDQIILWSVALEHSDAPTAPAMTERVLRLVRPGAIILMHDGANTPRETTVRALPLLIDGLKARGYRFETVPDMLGIPGDTAVTPVQ